MRPSKFTLCAIVFFVAGCTFHKDESNLTQKDLAYIQSLGLLGANEQIEMFESNGGFKGIKESGNFITSNRIAHYWVDGTNREIESAQFSNEIDSIEFTDLVSALTYASYLTIYKKDGTHFNVYIDADSARTYQFYNKARNNWIKNRLVR